MRNSCRFPALSKGASTLLLAALLAPLGLCAPARADIVVPGQRNIPRVSMLDFGNYAPHSVRLYRVEKGDTLSQIAERELGTVKRLPELTALNPGLDPAQLRVGAVLVLPPPPAAKDAAKGEAQAQGPWHFYVGKWGGRAGFERIQHAAALPEHHYTVTVFAAQGARVAEFEKLIAAPPKDLEKALDGLAAREGFFRSAALPGNRATVSDGSAVEREVVRLRVRTLTQGSVEIDEIALERYDKDDRLVVAGVSMAWWIAALLVAVLGALYLLRRHLRSGAPTSPPGTLGTGTFPTSA